MKFNKKGRITYEDKYFTINYNITNRINDIVVIFLPERHLITGIMMMALYFGIIMLISGKYIKRGDNAHLISGVDISYEEAKLPENIEKYSKDSKIVGNICLGVGSICFLIVIVYFIVINI